MNLSIKVSEKHPLYIALLTSARFHWSQVVVWEWALRCARDQVALCLIIIHELAQFSYKLGVVFIISTFDIQINTIHHSSGNENKRK